MLSIHKGFKEHDVVDEVKKRNLVIDIDLTT